MNVTAIVVTHQSAPEICGCLDALAAELRRDLSAQLLAVGEIDTEPDLRQQHAHRPGGAQVQYRPRVTLDSAAVWAPGPWTADVRWHLIGQRYPNSAGTNPASGRYRAMNAR